jgi:hypothetical protein
MEEVVGVEARFLKMEVVGICEGWWIWLLTFRTPRKMCLCTHQSITSGQEFWG